MSATIIDGRAVAARVRQQVARDVAALVAEGGTRPGLATVLVGDDPASEVYVGGKQRASAEAGIPGFDHRLAAESTHEGVTDLLGSSTATPRSAASSCSS